MANRERGELALVVGGVSYTLRLTTNACAELEDRSGKPYQDHLDAWTTKRSVVSFRWLIWAGLQDQHADIAPTPEAIGPLIDQAENLPQVLAAFIALNLDVLKALITDGIVKPAQEGSARPPIAQASRNGRGTTVPFARPA